MFTEGDRDELLRKLVGHARADPEIDAAASVGSAARQATDPWSDIDLALGLSEGNDVIQTAEHWTQTVAALADVSDTLDIWAGPALYRVFLLRSFLQLDISFWPAGTLAQTGTQAFELLFGTAKTPTSSSPADLHGVVAWSCLYALHGRSAIARNRPWQAMQMIDGLRGQVITLCCSRLKLETDHGRGVDQLPKAILTALTTTLPTTVSNAALARAFTAAVQLLSAEVEQLDPSLANRLKTPFALLQATASPASP